MAKPPKKFYTEYARTRGVLFLLNQETDNARFSVEIHNVEYGAPRDGMYEEEKYIEDVAFVYCDMIITRDGESEKVENHLPCIKIDGKWYTDD